MNLSRPRLWQFGAGWIALVAIAFGLAFMSEARTRTGQSTSPRRVKINPADRAKYESHPSFRGYTPDGKAILEPYSGEGELTFESLNDLAAKADEIVVGQVTTLQGQYPYLREHPIYTSPPQRVYGFQIEQNLKGDAGTVGSVISVVLYSGAELQTEVYRLAGRPWLVAGQRYTLFLSRPANYAETMENGIGYVADMLVGENGPVTAKTAELTDHFVMDCSQTMVMLSNGQAVKAQDTYNGQIYMADPPPFDDLQIFDVTEAEAIANIQTTVANVPPP